MINKIQDEIEKLEDEEKKADEIPFQGLTLYVGHCKMSHITEREL